MFAVVTGFAIRQRWIRPEAQVTTQVFVDIGAIVILMHASGGIASGLGGLLIVFVGASSLVLPLRVPPFFAAVATLVILGEQFFSQLGGFSDSGNYSAAGVLGAIIFAIAFSAKPLARRIQVSEALARQRGVDLANLSELNEYIVQHLRESIVVVDRKHEIRLINASAAKLLGAPADCRGFSLNDVSAALAAFLSDWRADLNTSSHRDLSIDPSEEGTGMTAHLAPLGRDDHRAGPVMIFLEDASLMNARVQQSKLASLGRLSASIAHEIRNPVGAMSHAGQLLAESEGTATGRPASDRNYPDQFGTRQPYHRQRSAAIAPGIQQAGTAAARSLAEDFAAEFTRTLELHEGELSVVEVPASLSVRMDPSHLRQVIWNLCDNAVKYASETGGILVELKAGRTQQNNRPYLEVLDQGHGVDPKTLDKIFEPFYTDKQGGTGLGLYISRELCELNRAALVCHPRQGGGSVFRIVFADPGTGRMTDSEFRTHN